MESLPGQEEIKSPNEALPEQFIAQEGSPDDRLRARLELAESMVQQKDGWVVLDPDPRAIEIEHPFEPLEVQRNYRDELRRYFDFKIDYYPHYDRPLTVRELSGWRSFIDLHDDVVDAKFPVDRDIRAYITAFRLSLQRNYRRFILRRRRDQLLLLLFLFAPLVAWILVPGIKPASAPRSFADLVPFLTGEGAEYGIGVALGYALVFGILLYNLATSRQMLASTLHANAGDLKAKVQRRINSLHQGYVHCVKAVNEAELASGNDDQWIDDAKFWAQLALWKPKRIEYIEKFYQSEMQRVRVHAFRWRVGMRLLGWVMVASALVIAGVLGSIAGDPVGIALAALVGVLSIAHYQIILSGPYMVEITDIRSFIGENDWKRFSDINFDEDFADIIRRDKMRIRQEKARGGGMAMPGRAA